MTLSRLSIPILPCRFGWHENGTYEGLPVTVFKIFSKQLGSMDRLLDELNALHHLRHPNVLLFLGACTDEKDNLYLVSERPCTEKLDQILSNHRLHLSWRTHLLPIAIDVCRAMVYLNAKNRPPRQPHVRVNRPFVRSHFLFLFECIDDAFLGTSTMTRPRSWTRGTFHSWPTKCTPAFPRIRRQSTCAGTPVVARPVTSIVLAWVRLSCAKTLGRLILMSSAVGTLHAPRAVRRGSRVNEHVCDDGCDCKWPLVSRVAAVERSGAIGAARRSVPRRGPVASPGISRDSHDARHDRACCGLRACKRARKGPVRRVKKGPSWCDPLSTLALTASSFVPRHVGFCMRRRVNSRSRR